MCTVSVSCSMTNRIGIPTCLAVVAGVSFNTVTRVRGQSVGTIPSILTRAAGTFVDVYEMVSNYYYNDSEK